MRNIICIYIVKDIVIKIRYNINPWKSCHKNKQYVRQEAMKKRLILALCLFFLGTPLVVWAAEVTSVGGACTTGTSRADWDSIFQCVSGTWRRAPIILGTGTCDSAHAGAIQWNGSAVQGCNGTSWVSF